MRFMYGGTKYHTVEKFLRFLEGGTKQHLILIPAFWIPIGFQVSWHSTSNDDKARPSNDDEAGSNEPSPGTGLD